jgi:hypothetical protein
VTSTAILFAVSNRKDSLLAQDLSERKVADSADGQADRRELLALDAVSRRVDPFLTSIR